MKNIKEFFYFLILAFCVSFGVGIVVSYIDSNVEYSYNINTNTCYVVVNHKYYVTPCNDEFPYDKAYIESTNLITN